MYKKVKSRKHFKQEVIETRKKRSSGFKLKKQIIVQDTVSSKTTNILGIFADDDQKKNSSGCAVDWEFSIQVLDS